MQFASLWSPKDVAHITKMKIFYVLMEMSLCMAINEHPRLSPTFFMQFSAYATFTANLHKVYIQARKKPVQKWHDFPYLVAKTYVQEVVLKWIVEWRTPSILDVGLSTVKKIFVAQKRKEASKQVSHNVATQKKTEAQEKACVEQERADKEQANKDQHESQKGDKSPSLKTEIEELSGQGSGGQEGSTPPSFQKA